MSAALESAPRSSAPEPIQPGRTQPGRAQPEPIPPALAHPDLLALARPHRLSALSPLVSLSRAALTCALAYLDIKHLPSPLTTPLVVALVVLVCGEALISTLRYWRTRWGVSDGRFWVHTGGLLRREQLSVELSALQSVDLRRPFLARILGLSQLSLSPSAGRPIRVSYVAHTAALALSRTLTSLAPLVSAPAAASASTRASTRRLLAAAALATLTELVAVVLVVSLVSLLVLTLAIAIVVVVEFPELLSPPEPAPVSSSALAGPVQIQSPALPKAAAPRPHTSLAAALVALGVLTLRHAFSRWRYYVERGWHFTLTRTRDPISSALLLHTQAGLFDAQQDSLAASRVQELTLIQHPSWRPWRWAEVVAHTSAHERVTLMPPAPLGLARALVGELFVSFVPLSAAAAPTPSRAALVRPVRRVRSVALGAELLVLELGVIARRTRALRLDRVQRVSVHSSPLMRALGLSRVELELAGRTRASVLLFVSDAHVLAGRLNDHARNSVPVPDSAPPSSTWERPAPSGLAFTHAAG